MSSLEPHLPVIAIVGPTASGKSQVALHVARMIGGEVVSADSMAVYRGMDIGTAKPGRAQRELVPHHLVDVVEPSSVFSAALYQRLSRRAIEDISGRGHRVVLAGGTGLYVRAALDDMTFPGPGDISPVDGGDATELFERLRELDPGLAASVDAANPRRVRRALQIASSGEEVGERDFKKVAPVYPVSMYGLRLPRPSLCERIDERVDAMIDDGLIDEVSRLRAGSPPMSVTACQALGYKEMLSYLEGETDLATAVATIKTRTRRLAKRQMTWFRADSRVQWLELSGDEPPEEVAEAIVTLSPSPCL